MDKTESILKIISLILFLAYLIISCRESDKFYDSEYIQVPHPAYHGQVKIYKICIENHEYYLFKYGTGTDIAPRLNSDGTPVSCP